MCVCVCAHVVLHESLNPIWFLLVWPSPLDFFPYIAVITVFFSDNSLPVGDAVEYLRPQDVVRLKSFRQNML